MKTILVSLNSKFIHSNLAIRYLSKYVADIETIDIHEFTINQSADFIAAEIFKLSVDVVGFSTYIWNLNETLKVCQILKMVNPKLKILLGGPEVSYDGEIMMKELPYIDYIIYGEGEETFKEFIQSINDNENGLEDIEGLIYRDKYNIVKNPERILIKDLNTIPFPYDEIEGEFTNKIVYYEASRGCPFNCQYCLSSILRGVRVFDIDRVKKDLTILIEGKVKQVKFVDRTFNANKGYAMEIMQFIKEKNPEGINFHFELTAHLIDKEFLTFLEDTKEGLFQFEIGVQSTNDNTIDAIGRTTDFDILSDVVRTIKSYKNIHQHLDLIAGLPYEGYESFKDSFNNVYNLKPEKLQLGFLKLLKGSGLRLREGEYGYKYIDEPPYEVLENKYIRYEELLKLKEIEDMIDKYYNEGNFEYTLNYLIDKYYIGAFEFYEELAGYWYDCGYHKVSHSKVKLYHILIEFIKEKDYEDFLLFTQLLKFDFVLNNKNSKLQLPYLEDHSYKSRLNIHDLLKRDEILDKHISEYKDIPTKKLINNVLVERFELNILEFIRRNYNLNIELEETFILFEYKDGVINKGNASNITDIVKEML